MKMDPIFTKRKWSCFQVISLPKTFIKYSPNLSKGKKHASTYNNDNDAGPSSPKKPRHDVPEVSDDIRIGDIGDAGEKWWTLENV